MSGTSGKNRYDREREAIRRKNGVREDLGKKQEKGSVSKYLTAQLKDAEEKLQATTDAKKKKKLEEIISNIKSTLSNNK